MKCPNCDVQLLMAERQGVGIDYCPQCRGIWLERGKLDEIIHSVSQSDEAPDPKTPSRSPYDTWSDEKQGGHSEVHQSGYRDEHDRNDGDHKRKKKSSFLGDILGGIGGE
jgi:Zn-finger nucleic acid-binding protein